MTRAQRNGAVNPSGRPCAVGIVVYRADPAVLIPLLRTAIREAAVVLLYLNSPLPDAVERFVCDQPRPGCNVVRLGDGTNVGLGVAYNALMAAACARDLGHVLLFDQDSSPPPGIVAGLSRRLAFLAQNGHRPAVIGPRVVDEAGHDFARPRARLTGSGDAADCVALEFTISSGSLFDAAAFERIGGFREDFFIDFIDVEWCARANALGYSCWTSLETVMTHRLGEGVVKVPWLPIHMTRQPASRAYTFVRNQVAMLGMGHVRLRQKLRTAVRLLLHTACAPLVARTPRATLRMMLLGWRHGFAGRLGPPPG